MAISQTAEYALRAVVWLAQRPGTPQTTQQIALGTHVSASYLPKVLQPLGRAGIISSQRGIKGGYSLNRNSESLSVLEVVSCVDPIKRISECPLGIVSHGGTLCPLHKMLDDVIAAEELRFTEVTIASLIKQETGSTPLCETDLCETDLCETDLCETLCKTEPPTVVLELPDGDTGCDIKPHPDESS